MRSQYITWAYWLLLENVWATHIPILRLLFKIPFCLGCRSSASWGNHFLSSFNALRLLKGKVVRYAGSHLRATPIKLSQKPLLPASANPLVPPCTASTAIAAVITAVLACTAISTAVALFPLSYCTALCCLPLSSPVSPFLPFLPLRCCRSSLFLCRSFCVASACVLLH